MNMNIVGATIGNYGQKAMERLARMSLRKRISIGLITSASLLLYLLSGVLLAWRHLFAGGCILLAGGLELLAYTGIRLSGKVSKFDAFIDAITARYSEMALFAGAITCFALRRNILFVVVSALAFAGVLMMSYAKAKAEALLPGVYDSGYLEHPERMGIFFVTCVLNRLSAGMLVIMLLAHIAVFHRIWDARQMAFNLEHPQQAGKGYGSPNANIFGRFFRSLIFWKYPRQTWQHDALSAFLLMLVILALLWQGC